MAERPLHVAIDGRELTGRPTGVGRYVSEVLKAWVSGPARHHYSVILPAPPPQGFPDPGGRITWVEAGGGSSATWWEQTTLAREVRRLAPDVLFAPAYTAPILVTVPTVLTVHDVSFFAHPEWFGWREGLRRRWLTRSSARRARLVTTVSEFSKEEILRWLPVSAERLVVAPNGAPPVDLDAPRDRDQVVLFAGSIFNRRHVPELIDAFALALRQVPDARLVLVGDNRTAPRQDPVGQARALGLEHRVEWHAYVDDATLTGFYRRAAVFAFLSDYEGFGLTPLEALAHGAAPLVLDTPLSREVYGEGARRVRLAPESIAQALVDLLTDAGARQALVAAGQQHLERYRWDRTAAILLETLERAVTP